MQRTKHTYTYGYIPHKVILDKYSPLTINRKILNYRKAILKVCGVTYINIDDVFMLGKVYEAVEHDSTKALTLMNMLEDMQQFQHESTKHVRRLNNVLNTFRTDGQREVHQYFVSDGKNVSKTTTLLQHELYKIEQYNNEVDKMYQVRPREVLEVT